MTSLESLPPLLKCRIPSDGGNRGAHPLGEVLQLASFVSLQTPVLYYSVPVWLLPSWSCARRVGVTVTSEPQNEVPIGTQERKGRFHCVRISRRNPPQGVGLLSC